ncbi:MAG: pyridoxal-dependent decarboxylase [Deltaproteobacteria bacterium]|nr:pyridoxal-dependent decarboxylase [Deltaproteobacteria bacterium]
MQDKTLQEIIDTFFTCNREELMEIFNELLNALQTDGVHNPGGLMSRNYATAQANPEIHTLTGNLRDARDAIFPFYWGTDEWYSKLHLENVKGPANYASLIGSLACLMKNPNLCIDTYSQRSNELEVKAITALANLVFYHTDSPWGVFNMGGTISNLYGGKIGIEKVLPQAMSKGLQGAKLAGLVSEAAHYSNKTLAGWLGIGTENLHSIATDHNFAMRLDLLEKRLDELYRHDVRVAFVIATFGSTDAFGIDDVAAIRNLIDAKAEEYRVPAPQLHVDAAVGWILCVLNEYDLCLNPFGIEEDVLPVIEKIQRHAKALKCADSVTVDFHKMGWGHYPASAFIVNRRDDLRHLLRTLEQVPYFSEAEYRHDPALFTLECSRPAIGPYSVMASLNGIGLRGYQVLLANALEMTALLKKELAALDYCKVLNTDTPGATVLWWVLPKGRNAEEIYAKLERGELTLEEQQRYFYEIKHLFDKRVHDLNPKIDARLSFTTAIGYSPHGINIPAWKAVFFNPKTDRPVVEQVIRSIEDL